MDNASIVKLENVMKIFGAKPERALAHIRRGATKAEIQSELGLVAGVYDVSLDIRRGETFIIMGLSGSGKSTLLRTINRLHEATAGKVLVGGTDIGRLSRKELVAFRRQKFGMVFQSFALLPQRTVLGNVEFGLEVQGVDKAERRRRSLEAIELVGLKGWENSRPDELSGGMRQRVGLARALAVDPEILLMDEAFSALDPLIRREMQDELLKIQAHKQRTIIFVTHDVDEAFKLGHRVAIMRHGQLVQVGTPDEIIAHPADDYIEAFIQGVDRTRRLTAGGIMQPAAEVAHPLDGPLVVLHKMKRAGLSRLLVVDSERRLHGSVRAEKVADMAEAGREVLDPAHFEPVEVVTPDRSLTEVIPLACKGDTPIAVLDADRQVIGQIKQGMILAALAEQGAAAPKVATVQTIKQGAAS